MATAIAASSKSRTIALLLCLFLGGIGVHRFYAGKWGTGLIQFFTLGLAGIWTFIDFILILMGALTDNEGRPISKW